MSPMQSESHLLGCGQGLRATEKANAATQKQQTENHGELSERRIIVLGGSSGIG